MECRIAQTLLERYLDNELERADARALEAHLDGCADCRAALTRLDTLRLALRDQALRHTAPAELRERIARSAASAAAGAESAPISGMATRSRRAPSAPAWWRTAAACVLAFAAGGAGVGLWNASHGGADERALLEHDLFASHWRALAATSPVDVVSSDRHTVKPWFAGKVAPSPLVVDFADAGFPLVGGRIDYLGRERVPVLVYRHGQHLIDVFVLPQSSGAIAPAVQREGYAVETVLLGGQRAAIVSDTDAQELAKFAGMLASAH
jgi:anti-sigma factor RsiW